MDGKRESLVRNICHGGRWTCMANATLAAPLGTMLPFSQAGFIVRSQLLWRRLSASDNAFAAAQTK
jgi:hypothetical protein